MSKNTPVAINRRTFVAAGAIALGSVMLAGCSSRAQEAPTMPESTKGGTAMQAPTTEEPSADVTVDAATPSRTLIVYFSRAGMNYTTSGPVHTDVGNTAVMATFIRNAIGCDAYEIIAAKPYPYEYEPTVEQNQREQQENARPAIAGELPDLAPYETILVGSGVWHGNPPLIMHTFFEAVDTTGKTIVPFTTHAGSGLGSAVTTYQALCPHATVSENSLAISGERVHDAQTEVEEWAKSLGLV